MKPAAASYTVVEDPVHGYKRLDPLPDNQEVSQFYESQYYHLIKQGNRAPEIRRLMEGGAASDRERAWLSATLYTDIHEVLTQNLGQQPGSLLDVGCGTGDLIEFLKGKGWAVSGLELSQDAAALARKKGLDVYTVNLDQLSVKHPQFRKHFNAITLINVLEHVLDPVTLLTQLKSVLAPGGIAAIRVPNDFTELQKHAQAALNKAPWWVAVPDHVNYFDFASLTRLLDRLGFDTVYQQGDFPMELFLLMGDDYVGSPEVGPQMHQKRCQFEHALPSEYRRRLYHHLAKIGVGRDCFVFARLRRE